MTVVEKGANEGAHILVTEEIEQEDNSFTLQTKNRSGSIMANLKIGANTTLVNALISNDNISNPGVKLHGSGFIITPSKAKDLGLGTSPDFDNVIKAYRNGRDLTSIPRDVLVIDLFGYSSNEVMVKFPSIYQHVFNEVKPERDNNKRESRKKYWWLFGETNKKLRDQLFNLPRYITTVETSKYRFFTFLDKSILPDNKLVNIALAGAEHFSIISSQIHVLWSLANGSQLGPTPVYVKTRCFETFPFPEIQNPDLKNRLTTLGEQLDAHRKARQAEHPDLTLTGVYNVLEKLRSGEALTDKDKLIHDQGLVTLLKQLHDDIDQATYEAYGWSDIWQWRTDCHSGTCYDPEDQTTTQLELSPDTSIHEATSDYREKYDQVLLQRLVDLNHLRAAEEAKGKIRYLRPDYQDPDNTQRSQPQELALPAAAIAATKAKTAKLKWPKELPQQVTAVLALIPDLGTDAEEIATMFGRKSAKRTQEVTHIITMLESLGQINR